MPRDVLGLDPYQRSAISCARAGCAASAVSLLAAVGVLIYTAVVPSAGPINLHVVAGALAILSVFVLIIARIRLNKESLAWNDLC